MLLNLDNNFEIRPKKHLKYICSITRRTNKLVRNAGSGRDCAKIDSPRPSAANENFRPLKSLIILLSVESSRIRPSSPLLLSDRERTTRRGARLINYRVEKCKTDTCSSTTPSHRTLHKYRTSVERFLFCVRARVSSARNNKRDACAR